MVKTLRVQDKKQIESIVIMLHNVAYKISDEMSKYESRKINTVITIGYCLYENDDNMHMIEMDIANGSVYIENNDCKHYLNNKTEILYLYDDIVARIDRKKSNIIEENEKMYENGETIKQMLKSIL